MSHTDTALAFIRHAQRGDIAAASALVTPQARHHNMYFPAGMNILIEAIASAHVAFPDSTFTPKHIVANDDMVVIHSHVTHTVGDRGMSVFHMFRFQNGLIAEMWDVGQAISADCPNIDGLF